MKRKQQPPKEIIMTAKEMEKKFASEWILVGDPETNKALEVIKGKVLHHSRDRDEVYRKAVELRPKRFAMLYTGRMPKDTAIVLSLLKCGAVRQSNAMASESKAVNVRGVIGRAAADRA